MFTKKITDADEFISLPSSTQALYLHLCMAADDDGFNNQIQMAMFKAHASLDDVKVLLAKRFILQFENGVIVIKHWRMANALRKDRYTPTAFQEELKKLKIKDNGSYTFDIDKEELVAEWLPDGCQVVAVDKNSIDKNSIGKNNSTPRRKIIPPELEWVKEYCKERNNKVDPEKFFDFYESKGWKVGKEKMKDWEASVRTWEKDDNKKQEPKKNDFKNFTQSNYDWDEINKELGIK